MRNYNLLREIVNNEEGKRQLVQQFSVFQLVGQNLLIAICKVYLIIRQT